MRAIRVSLQKSDDDWVFASGVKSQMQRMDPAFKEKSLGFSSFRAFVESRNARRIARGEPPLDVEAEVERRLSGQDG